MLPCPHCGELIWLNSGLRRFPIRCPRCGEHSAFPLESRLRAILVMLLTGLATVSVIKIFSLDKASTALGISVYAAVLVAGIVLGGWLVGRSTRKTATYLVKLRRLRWFR